MISIQARSFPGTETSMPAVSQWSEENRRLFHWARGVQPASGGKSERKNPVGLDERLFDAKAHAKMLASSLSMHLKKIDENWKTKLFGQLDRLHEIEEWDVGDEPLRRSSFATFLRAIIFLNSKVRPSVGLTDNGHMLFAWGNGSNVLSLEALPDNQVRWIVSCEIDESRVRASGLDIVARLPLLLSPYNPSQWFDSVEG